MTGRVISSSSESDSAPRRRLPIVVIPMQRSEENRVNEVSRDQYMSRLIGPARRANSVSSDETNSSQESEPLWARSVLPKTDLPITRVRSNRDDNDEELFNSIIKGRKEALSKRKEIFRIINEQKAVMNNDLIPSLANSEIDEMEDHSLGGILSDYYQLIDLTMVTKNLSALDNAKQNFDLNHLFCKLAIHEIIERSQFVSVVRQILSKLQNQNSCYQLFADNLDLFLIQNLWTVEDSIELLRDIFGENTILRNSEGSISLASLNRRTMESLFVVFRIVFYSIDNAQIIDEEKFSWLFLLLQTLLLDSRIICLKPWMVDSLSSLLNKVSENKWPQMPAMLAIEVKKRFVNQNVPNIGNVLLELMNSVPNSVRGRVYRQYLACVALLNMDCETDYLVNHALLQIVHNTSTLCFLHQSDSDQDLWTSVRLLSYFLGDISNLLQKVELLSLQNLAHQLKEAHSLLGQDSLRNIVRVQIKHELFRLGNVLSILLQNQSEPK